MQKREGLFKALPLALNLRLRDYGRGETIGRGGMEIVGIST